MSPVLDGRGGDRIKSIKYAGDTRALDETEEDVTRVVRVRIEFEYRQNECDANLKRKRCSS